LSAQKGNPFPQGFAGSNPALSTNNSKDLRLFREILLSSNACKI
jgi:hypothetical protein